MLGRIKPEGEAAIRDIIEDNASNATLTQHTQSIVDGDDNHLAIAGQHRSIVGVATIPLERFAVQINQHRMRLFSA